MGDFNFNLTLAGYNQNTNNGEYDFNLNLLEKGGQRLTFRISIFGSGEVVLHLPGNVEGKKELDTDYLFDLQIQKKGNTFKAFLNDEFIAAARVLDFTNFTGFSARCRTNDCSDKFDWKYRISHIKITSF